ncbi:anhydro-N-acetylmuramic acid kinase [Rhodanobacter glycinis]|uniref:Anhydro-N-acetylmuramic acid kinase n=1 Tax=Rhodanobacter glycinis TaxID=582702 RepID=A0A502CD12_9GAMM|nr:anhydro-N-acetylmuramic acid kinase [Rhodanobacter glycinis]TPG09676.1 anhydro-N-acetylmuramic acid kinase [Rhodanobacter glycinis]TPG46579.1 anhydro-N-acetylmuramic acid kinase [Rhodanobacter glycinis]
MNDASAPYLGLISGTSADSIDAVLVSFSRSVPQLLASHALPWPPTLRDRMLALAQGEAALDVDAFGRLDVEIGCCFADAALQLLEQSGTAAQDVRAIGSHGQTLRHRPTGAYPFTLQLGDPSVIAERCRIDVVADFRRADIAAGGQGAPLLPALHAMLLGRPGFARVVLNLGGIANITVLGSDGSVRGFDTGPANGLLDAWCQRHRGEPFDRDGAFASSGHVSPGLLDAMLTDSYFALPPPKSTGREHFHLDWLATHAQLAALTPADVQATLLELTARSVVTAITQQAPTAEEILVCGGGVHNVALMRRLGELLAPRIVLSTSRYGIDPDFLEATAFAWLARRRLLGLPGNLPAVTGAVGPRVLGAIYSAPAPDSPNRILSGAS